MSGTLAEWSIAAVQFLGLWLIAAIPAYFLFTALRHFLPEGVGPAARRLLDWIPWSTANVNQLIARIGEAHDGITRHASARLILERRHKTLHARLTRLRGEFDARLRQLEASITGGADGRLQPLLTQFKTDLTMATRFGKIDDQIAGQVVELRRARAERRMWFIGAAAIALINFWLLWIFFDDAFGGAEVPLIGLNLGLFVAALFPVLEFYLGIFWEAAERTRRGATRVLMLVGAAFAVFVIGAAEYFIFYSLGRGMFEQIPEFEVGGGMHMLFGLLGSTLTLFQAMLGNFHSQQDATVRELGAISDLKRQIADANKFVDALPGRLSAIDAAAAQARASIDRLHEDLSGRGQAVASLGDTFRGHREELLAAIDSVNPAGWHSEPEAELADRADAARFAWALGPALVIVGLVYGLVATQLLAAADLFSGAPAWVTPAAAVASVLIGLAAGALVFDRIGVALAMGDRRRDVLAPRDPAFRVAGAAITVAVIVAIVAAGVRAHGWAGVIEALLLAALFVAIVVMGGYIEHVARGLEFTARLLLVSAIYGGRLLWTGVCAGALSVAAGLLWLIYAVAGIVAWPLLAVVAWAYRRRLNTDDSRVPLKAAA